MAKIYGNTTATPLNPDMFGSGDIPISKAVKIDRITPMLPTGLYVLESSAIMVETEETDIDEEGIERPYVSLILAENTADMEANTEGVFYVYIARPWQDTPYKGSKFDSHLTIIGAADYISLGLGCRNMVDLTMHYDGTKNIPTLTVEERADDFRKIKAGVELELIAGRKKIVIGDRYGVGIYENNGSYDLSPLEVFTPEGDHPYCAANKLYVDTKIGDINSILATLVEVE